MHRSNSKPKVEFLEARMLLSAVDIPQDAISATGTDGTILGDSQVHVYLDAYGQHMTVMGPAAGDVTIHLDELPANIVLSVSSFDSVTLVGENTLFSLLVTDVNDVDAGQVSIGGGALGAFNVEHIRIDQVPSRVLIGGEGGPDSFLTGDRTLIEANHFSDEVFIISDVKALGLSSDHAANSLVIENRAADPLVLLNLQPEDLNRSGFDDPQTQIGIVSGDFAAYFLAAPSEQAALEQALLASRHPAISNPVPLANLLDDFTFTATNSSISRSEVVPLAIRLHDLSSDHVASRIDAQVLSDGQPEAVATAADASRLPFDFVSDLAPTTETLVHFHLAGTNVGGPMKLAAFGAFDAESHSTEHFGEAVTNAMHALTSRLSQPFAELASEFGAGLATFGDLVAARFADHLKIDHQYALLVDTRPVRTSEDRDLLVLTV